MIGQIECLGSKFNRLLLANLKTSRQAHINCDPSGPRDSVSTEISECAQRRLSESRRVEPQRVVLLRRVRF